MWSNPAIPFPSLDLIVQVEAHHLCSHLVIVISGITLQPFKVTGPSAIFEVIKPDATTKMYQSQC